jgi:molybdate/tungstate transport system substrate-binding protein
MRHVKFFISFLWFFCILSTSLARQEVVLKVFHAGSLSVPFAEMEQVFEKRYPYIDVQREASGSVQAVRKVTDLHKPCDVIAVADYDIIPKMMFPDYVNYVKLFARNEIVICYTDKSRYVEKINGQNWYKILARPNVKWAFANPNDDPCGYRTLMTMALASIYYKEPNLFSTLLGEISGLVWKKEGGILITTPTTLATTKNIFIRSKSVELLGLLESGAIDYAFEYKSVGKQHHLHYAILPAEINLSDLAHKDLYAQVKVQLSNGKVMQGKPIVYGIATLKKSRYPQEAKLWEDFVTGKEGAEILRACFQTPIFPAKIIKAYE